MVGPAIEANNFEIKTGLITLIQQTVQFSGFPNEDPNQHLIDFLETCGLVKFKGVNSDAIRKGTILATIFRSGEHHDLG